MKELEPIIGVGLFFELKLPSSAPRSLISHSFIAEMDAGSNVIDVVVTFTKRLYSKYIDAQTANLRVNLSPDLEAALSNVFKFAHKGSTFDTTFIMPLLERAVIEVGYALNLCISIFRITVDFVSDDTTLCTKYRLDTH